MKNLTDLTVKEFVQALSSKDPVPGGGGATALCGALGAALAGMVANLTVGKKAYSEVEEFNQFISKTARDLSERFLNLIDKDAQGFIPLSKAYSLPSSTEEEKKIKQEAISKGSIEAIKAPLEMIQACQETTMLLQMLYETGSRLAFSDVGVGADLILATLQGALCNIQANMVYIRDAEFLKNLKSELFPTLLFTQTVANKLAKDVKLTLADMEKENKD